MAGSVCLSICICARLSIWNTPVVSARWIERYTAGSSKGMRERSIRSPRMCAISTTQRSTAESIPSPSRSIFRKPASAHESLSHCTSWRPVIAAGWIGQISQSGSVEMTIPPGCCETWRGSPCASCTSATSARQRGELSIRRLPTPPLIAFSMSRSISSELHGSTERAARSTSPGGSPSALAKSRTAPRVR